MRQRSVVTVSGLALAALAGPSLSCVGPGLLTDGSTVSVGHHSHGFLRAGRRLPPRGEGYRVPPRWLARDRSHGTDELVELLVQTARRVRQQRSGALLGVADLSPRGGGPTPEHRSHHSGRDVDLLLYAVDGKGTALIPQEMVAFDARGASVPDPRPAAPTTATAPAPGSKTVPAGGLATITEPAHTPQVFDLRRNWALVKALVTHPRIRVQWIFLGAPLIRLVLDHAERSKEPRWLVDRAAAVLHQPGDAQNHMDHMHVRIYCAPADRLLGCVDRGPPRWMKKEIKYGHFQRPMAQLPGLERLERLSLRIHL